MEAIAAGSPRPRGPSPVGLNLGANKDSPDRARDFAQVLTCCGPHVDFATVNVSSPNTERLRDLQGRAALEGLLAGVMEANAALATPVPIFLKIAPDLDVRGWPRSPRSRRPPASPASSPRTRRCRAKASPRATATRPAGCRASRCSSAARGSWRGSTG
jgi:hypothetical protein